MNNEILIKRNYTNYYMHVIQHYILPDFMKFQKRKHKNYFSPCSVFGILYILISIYSTGCAEPKAEMRPLYTRNCRDHLNSIVNVTDVKLRLIDGAATVQKTFTFKEDLNHLRVQLNVWKCRAEENPNTCEVIMSNVTLSRLCDNIKQEGLWKKLIENLEPPVRQCPIKAGDYKLLVNAKNSVLSYIPSAMLGGVWKLRVYAFDYTNEKLILCVDTAVKYVTKYGA